MIVSRRCADGRAIRRRRRSWNKSRVSARRFGAAVVDHFIDGVAGKTERRAADSRKRAIGVAQTFAFKINASSRAFPAMDFS
jgi:hypothetical protein